MKFSRMENIFVVLLMMSVFVAGVSFAVQNEKSFVSQAAAISENTNNSLPGIEPASEPVYVPPQKLSNPPEIIKSVYVTGYSAGTKKYLNYLSNLFKTTEINAVVVDIKGSDGYISYNSGAPDVKKYNLYRGAIKDIDSLVRFLHDQNIYLIGRIAVFEDPVYSKAKPELAVYNKAKTVDLSQPILWRDNNKLSWLDPASKDVWNYDVSLAKDALYHGFDEINFDYVRFPTDGKTENMGFPVWDMKSYKASVIKDFFQYLRANLAGEKISVDLFGQTTTNTDDMGIGQIIENAFENFDYISPMVYPSHYAANFLNFKKPAEHPYEIIKYSMETALDREKSFLKREQDENSKIVIKDVTAMGAISSAPETQVTTIVPEIFLAKFRPWLQDFDMGADYNAEMVIAEIKATQDALGADYKGFMLWNPSNIYTASAVLK